MLQATFAGMGSRVHITLLGGSEADLTYARGRLAQLEARWSRFLPGSELTRLNAEREATVSAETADLVRLAVGAWDLTGGLFDPTVHDALVGAGYDRTFTALATRTAGVTDPVPPPGCAGVRVDGEVIHLPEHVRLDLGGIGKGRAADLVATELLARGVAGACVNVGGDVRVLGTPPAAAGAWAVAVEDPSGTADRAALVALDDGAVATSTTVKRRWSTTDGQAHHLIDPRTGSSSASDVVACTVVAAEAVWAEVFAKCAVVAGAGPGRGLVDRHGLAALITLSDGTTVRTNSFERYEPWTVSSGGSWPARAE